MFGWGSFLGVVATTLITKMSTSQTASNSGNPFIFSYSKSLFRCLDVPVQKSFFGLPLKKQHVNVFLVGNILAFWTSI